MWSDGRHAALRQMTDDASTWPVDDLQEAPIMTLPSYTPRKTAKEEQKKVAKGEYGSSKMVRGIFHGGHSEGHRDNLRAKLDSGHGGDRFEPLLALQLTSVAIRDALRFTLIATPCYQVHWIRYAGRWAPRVMHSREVELMEMLAEGIGDQKDYGYALEVACREGHRDGIIFFLSTPGMADLLRPFMVKCTVCAAEASNDNCFGLMLDQLTSSELSELAESHPNLYRSTERRRSSVPIARRRRRSSLAITQGGGRGSEHSKLLRLARRKAGNVVRAWRLYFDPRSSNGKLDFDTFVVACKEANVIGDYARAFLEAQGIEPPREQTYLHPNGCVTFYDLFDHNLEGTALRPSEILMAFRSALNNAVRNLGRVKGSNPAERWTALFETTSHGRRIPRDHFTQVCEKRRLMPPETDLNTLFDWLDVDRDDHLLESDFEWLHHNFKLVHQ
ncbi:hypothetical protein Pmar_PMAR000441 [Perkinsus marinus ATCC 50983]|uniref:EF-hand domain-containing protein n=1 Tax=Perkinsus marinus (strain ATCC 50983 / TXsc) TaxID=423536 RepID=C5L4G3_PERM5|nr:hypothetical protein Pmar_PMAR000441 [Perkinsus marinus ATCC 50983]EER08400.1 hypothetical protein Pmar_PMAR000441 [Perkinsus marinus ATCC 50983]|eukprot:XP_002776584.1 hypothetical protein Pmar_PMAR000441 [Perkinsus marinus ATCC 50983]